MKIRITKTIGKYQDEDLVGTVHLIGPIDATACGIADEDFVSKPTSKPIDCSVCLTYLRWAKQASKVNK